MNPKRTEDEKEMKLVEEFAQLLYLAYVEGGIFNQGDASPFVHWPDLPETERARWRHVAREGRRALRII